MGIAREAEIVQLETLLAEVMSFADLDRNLLGPLQATIEASGVTPRPSPARRRSPNWPLCAQEDEHGQSRGVGGSG